MLFRSYRDPEEVERDLEGIAAAKALAAGGEADAVEAAVPDWEISGPAAGVAAAAASTLPSAEAGSSLSLILPLPFLPVLCSRETSIAHAFGSLRLVRNRSRLGRRGNDHRLGCY